jgi:uncharacterized protein (TIGR03067 family)
MFASVVFIALPWATSAQSEKGATDDLKKIQGSWSVVAEFGKTKNVGNRKWIFNGNKYLVKEDGKITEEGTFTLDASTKPARIDLQIFKTKEGPKVKGKFIDKGKFQQGIYLLEGDTLKVCFTIPGKQTRPTSFSTKAKETDVHETCKRDNSTK